MTVLSPAQCNRMIVIKLLQVKAYARIVMTLDNCVAMLTQCQIAYMYVLNVRASTVCTNKGAFIYLHQEMAGIGDSTGFHWIPLKDDEAN